MVKNARKGILLGAAGLVAGVALGAMGMMSLRGGDGPYATSPPNTRSMGAAAGPGAASTFVTAVSVNCELPPMLASGGEGDGQVALQARPAAASGSEVASLILSGKEAAAAGRPRDAEVSFLNACRNAAVLQGGDGIPLSDAMYQLGRHYATVAAFGAPRSRELLQRAERLYSASLEGYRARLGPTHEKTRFAQEGLITVRQGTAGTVTAGAAAPTPPAPAPATPAPPAAPARAAEETVAAAPVAPVPVPAPVAKAAPEPPPAPAPVAKAASAKPAEAPAQPAAASPVESKPVQQARRTSPSFNCAQARSTTEKLICGDEELARMDRELGAMHQRAREASADPRAFQRDSDAEWARREATCRDRECLQRWYAERRAQLSAQASSPPAARRPAAAASARPEAARTPASAAEQPPPRPRRVVPSRTATADASPEAPPAPPPPSSTMGASPGGASTAEGSAGAPD